MCCDGDSFLFYLPLLLIVFWWFRLDIFLLSSIAVIALLKGFRGAAVGE